MYYCVCVSRYAYICPERVSLHQLLYVSAPAIQAPLWGFWEWAWCVYMVSGVCAVMANRCVLLLVSAFTVLTERRVHNHTRPYALVQIGVWAHASQNHILRHFSPLFLIKGVWSLHAKQTLCLMLFWPLTHPCPRIKRYFTRTKYQSMAFD